MNDLHKTTGYTIIHNWLASKGYKPFAYQEETWQHILNGKSGLVNAPTGTGKTFSVFLGSLIRFIEEDPLPCKWIEGPEFPIFGNGLSCRSEGRKR